MTEFSVTFFDIDGVVNSVMDYEDQKNVINYTSIKQVNKRLVGYFNDYIESTGSKIVVTSVWRYNQTVESMQVIFDQLGIKGEIIGITPRFASSSEGTYRGNEIDLWMKDNKHVFDDKPPKYVIFDDDGDMLYWQRNHYFKCDGWTGITPHVTYRAKRFLNGHT